MRLATIFLAAAVAAFWTATGARSYAAEKTVLIETSGYCGSWVFYGLESGKYKKCVTDGKGRYFENCSVSLPYPSRFTLGVGGHGDFKVTIDSFGDISIENGHKRRGLEYDKKTSELRFITKEIKIYPNGINGRWGFEGDTAKCDARAQKLLVKTIVYGIPTFLTTTTAGTDITAGDLGSLTVSNSGSFDVAGDHAVIFRTAKVVLVADKPDRVWALGELWFDGGKKTATGAAEVTMLRNSTVKVEIPDTKETGSLSLVDECYVIPRQLMVGAKPFQVYLPASVCGRR